MPRPDGGDVAGNGDNELPHALSIATEYEKAQEAWEEERHELKATVHQTAEELCALVRCGGAPGTILAPGLPLMC